MEKMKKIKELESLVYQAEKEYETSFNENLDDETTEAAYDEYWNCIGKIAAVIVELINVEEKTAIRMAEHKRTEIIAMLKRMAA